MTSSKTTVLSVRLPNELAEIIRKGAKESRTSPSQLMVDILADWLDKHGYLKPRKERK